MTKEKIRTLKKEIKRIKQIELFEGLKKRQEEKKKKKKQKKKKKKKKKKKTWQKHLNS